MKKGYCNSNNLEVGDYVFYIDKEGSHNPAKVVSKTAKMATLDYGGVPTQRVRIESCIFQ